MKHAAITIVMLLWIVVGPALANAKVHRIKPSSDLEKILKRVRAGDTILLRNGTWKDAVIRLEDLSGTLEKPIFVKAEAPGEVIFTGKSQFSFSGQYVVVSGLVFRDMYGLMDAVEFRAGTKSIAHHCRLTDCVFEQVNKLPDDQKTRWLSIHGAEHRVDHCYFAGKTNEGATVVVWVTKEPGRHQLDHNHFGARPELGTNGGETIRIGTSAVSENDSLTVVKDNLFQECDGEVEVISNKSCGNIYRNNVFERCAGSLTLRHGHRCLVDGNVFLGKGKADTGGVRIIGREHKVINNYFEKLRGDSALAAIAISSGIRNSPLNGYAPVVDALVVHNTVIDCEQPVRIGVGAGSKDRVVAPKESTVAFNLFVPHKREVLVDPVNLSGISFRENVCRKERTEFESDRPLNCRYERVTLKRAEDGLMRPKTDKRLAAESESKLKWDIDRLPRPDLPAVGCDQPDTPFRPLVSEKTTGPTWRKQSSE
jgi:poly(beta-D-mannuronate) lyase